jgi:glutamate racemase
LKSKDLNKVFKKVFRETKKILKVLQKCFVLCCNSHSDFFLNKVNKKIKIKLSQKVSFFFSNFFSLAEV